MLSKSRTVVAAIALGLLAALTAAAPVAAQTSSSDSAGSMPPPSVVELAASDPQFSTLVSAVTQADLAGTLGGEGPFTIFAPTNEAFAKIPASDLQAILADKALLTDILTYHVVSGKVLAGDLKKKQKVETVEGARVKIVKKKNGPMINGAAITSTDLVGRNGVIHVIDTVLLPPAAR